MTTALLDGNVYDKLAEDPETRERLAQLVNEGVVTVVATPVVVDEMTKGPCGGLPDWFPIARASEAVAVLGYARLGAAYLSSGEMYRQHRGDSNKIPDAIIAHSADALADILVSEDRRCRVRLGELSDRCRSMSYEEFRGGSVLGLHLTIEGRPNEALQQTRSAFASIAAALAAERRCWADPTGEKRPRLGWLKRRRVVANIHGGAG